MEGTHNFEIIGGGEKEKKKVSDRLQEEFDNRYAKLEKYEMEKTPEDLEILKKVEERVDETVKKYGGVPRNFPRDHLYLLPPGAIAEYSNKRILGGVHVPLRSVIGVEREDSNLMFASTIAHELFHLKGFKSVRIFQDGEQFFLNRTGISLIDNKTEEVRGEEKEYFIGIEEALVTELTRRLVEALGEEEEFKAESESMGKIRNWLAGNMRRRKIAEDKIEEFSEEFTYIDNPENFAVEVEKYSKDENSRQNFAQGRFDRMYTEGLVEFRERYSDRKKFKGLILEIVEKSEGKYIASDIFDEFAKAHFTGRYLPLAHLVEEVLGKGSFRKIANDFSRGKSKNIEAEEGDTDKII